MQTLAEKYPDAIKRFKQIGLVHLAELCGRHYRQVDMADQIGHPSAISKWLTLEHLPSRQVEERARQALEEQARQVLEEMAPHRPEQTLDLPEPVPAAPEENVLMVVCPPGSEEKVQRVLAMLRCEVEVI